MPPFVLLIFGGIIIKDMIATAIISGALALGSAIYGAVSSNQKNRKAQNILAKRQKELKDWYNIQKSKDFTQRADMQSIINNQKKTYQDTIDRLRASNAVVGGTDQSLAAAKQQANDSVADTYSSMAQMASAYKDQLDQQNIQQQTAMDQQKAAAYQQQAAAAAQAGAQGTAAGLNVMGNELQDTYAKKAAAAAENDPYNKLKGPVNNNKTGRP